MTTAPAVLRAEPHRTVGSVIQRDAGVILKRWADRAKAEQPTAKRVHHHVLLDHLPTFLWELGQALAESGDPRPDRHARSAEVHGDQRWETGWSINELVRDYQLLRIVLIEFLEEALDRPLASREVMALGVAVDDAIEASVAAYAAAQAAVGGKGKPAGPADGLLDVLGYLGHEMRNPLAPLGNAVQILRLTAGQPDQVEKTSHLIERQVRVLTRLVDDMLDLPRLARGKLSLQRERIDLGRLVRECAEDRRAALAEAGVRLDLNLPADPVWTSGDETRLGQAVGNLLGNAQKFTDRGGAVRVSLAIDPARPVAVLTVRDTGVGIDPAFLPKVFDTFMQADRSLDRTRGGLGLGLALVKGIVELHGGAVRAASDGPGRGAEFTVELPLLALVAPPAPSAPAAGHRPDRPMTSRRVLVIEDNRDSAESLRMYLELVGHRVTVAHTGPDGLAVAAAAPPEVVISDIGLPGMTGYEIGRELRKNPALAGVLLVALSGDGSDGSREQALAAGFDAYFVKPVNPDELVRFVGDARPATGSP